VYNLTATKGHGPLWVEIETALRRLYVEMPFSTAGNTPFLRFSHAEFFTRLVGFYLLMWAYFGDFVASMQGKKKR
jgi:hypothetical protein